MTTETLTGSRARRAALVMLALLLPFLWNAEANSAMTPSQWVNSFWPTAKAAGVSQATYQAALRNFTPDPEVLKKAGTQTEFKTQIWDYLDMTVSEERIAEGKAALASHGDLLKRIEERYGVDRYIVAAIWGVESHYGAVLDNPKIVKSAIRSLATLAYAGGRRAKYGRQQLIAALKIIQRGDITLRGMTGSWAGALGHTQFIPTTYVAYAVDFDGDGKRNVWSPVDALASTGAYLDKMGWQDGRTWGYEVILPSGFNTKATSARTIAAWQKLGIRRPGGRAFPRPGDTASLLLPAGTKGPAFLVLKNFSVIKRYNVSTSYALAVGHLSDRLRGGGPFEKPWPRNSIPLNAEQRVKLQQLLMTRGYYSGVPDGEIGSGSREAIRAYQLAVGFTPDGVPSLKVLQALEAGK
jgi:membrane-bound lytic murein transglycosylase B